MSRIIKVEVGVISRKSKVERKRSLWNTVPIIDLAGNTNHVRDKMKKKTRNVCDIFITIPAARPAILLVAKNK